MRTFITCLIFMFVVCVVPSVMAQPSWGPNCVSFDIASGNVYWNGVDDTLAREGLRGSFEYYGDTSQARSDGDRLHLRNDATYRIWIRFPDGGVITLSPGQNDWEDLANHNGLPISLIHCEENPSPPTVNRINRNGAVSGWLPIRGSIYYSIVVPNSSFVTIDLQSSEFDSFLNLYRAGERIESNDDGGEGLDSLISSVVLNPGTYMIEVTSFMRMGGGSYILQTRTEPIY